MYLELSHLAKRYGDREAIRDVSLSIAEGELLCMLGPSGCGKTTLLNMVGGFIKPDGGTITLDGEDITHLPPELCPVTTVFQSYGLFPHMTVEQNVAYGLKFRGLNRPQARGRAQHYLGLVGLEDYTQARIHELSGGQQQRVALARALAVEPKVCLLDEPFSNLDAALRTTMRAELKRLQRDLGTTMIFVTHDQEEALVLGDRLALIHEGRLAQLARPLEVLRHPANDYVATFMGVSNYRWEDDELLKVVCEGV